MCFLPLIQRVEPTGLNHTLLENLYKLRVLTNETFLSLSISFFPSSLRGSLVLGSSTVSLYVALVQ